MMRKAYIGMVALAALAGCQTAVPDSNPQGAGFQDYNSYLRNHAAGVQDYGSQGPSGGVMGEGVATQPMGTTGFSTDGAAAAIAAAEGGVSTGGVSNGVSAGAIGAPMNAAGLGTGGIATGIAPMTTAATPTTTGAALPPIDSTACAGRGNAFAGIAETTAEMDAVGGVATGGVSDEQDFNAVKSRETIASDKQRIECNRQQYVVVQPGALPVRPGDEGPNIAAYALSTNNPPGAKLYRRPAFYLINPAKACAKFTSSDKAQQAFLAAGGPQKDPKALDPDGDGFACAWDPRPFRAAKQ